MHILCGVDESAGGEAAANVAALVAAAFDARPDFRVVADNPAAQLRAAARELAGDLVIIGAAPRTRFAGALYAGTGQALVQRGDCPVMVVPAVAAATTGQGVAVTYDASGASDGAVAVAARLASALERSLTVIHVLPDPRSYTRPVLPMHDDVRSVVEAALDGAEVDLRHVFAYRLPAPHLARIVAQVQPAFLVTAAPKRGWRSLFRPSVGARLLRRAACPVVLVPEGAAGRVGQRPATRALAAA